nr:putative ribonuclease H-like domain-containing protein [Tanacetum cinerariifolium]
MKIGSSRRVKSPLEKDSLGAQEDASKQRGMIKEIDQDDEIELDADTQGKKNDDEMFGVDDLSGDEVVTTVADKVSTAPVTYVTEDEITMAQALAALKSVKPKVVVQEKEVSTTIPAIATTITTAVLTPRAKDPPFDLEAYSNSDYARASLDMKSITGGCQFLSKRLISWQCKKQTIVANFTTEAEYVAAANCCGQVLWI